MKKALVTVLAIAMTLCCLSGCGAKNVQQETGSTASTEVQKDSDTAILKEATEVVGEVGPGTYFVEVESSSSMFKIKQAELTIAEDGSMTAVLTMNSKAYTKLYMGTGEQASVAEETACIAFAEDKNGAYKFTIPVEALDKPLDCAAFSKRKEKWYDRQLTFLADTLSTEANTGSTEVSGEMAVVENGTYTIDLTCEGGSGKAFIISPATITITDDAKIATVKWNSENYDYMMVGGEKYLPISVEGGSVFEIPISSLDEKLPVIGDTVAMSKAREIEYNITFHSGTMKPVE
jgi:hypothetical protein